eukprot:TRINITY_DN645_c0_g1_i19.p2 TRINITY_DN645_c0_g1~~TRINITY_DN645_c0_g1_i19.p2  ORF type:complete len:165 (+),score=48.21 TRINITY_DN645_c0_g1_i19:917-1411(+)
MFDAVKIHLGMLGVVYSIKIQVRDDWNAQLRYETIPRKQWLDEFEAKVKESKYYQALWWPYTDKASHTYRDELESLDCTNGCQRCIFQTAATCFVPCQTNNLYLYPERTPQLFESNTGPCCGCGSPVVDIETSGYYEEVLLTVAQPTYVEMEYCQNSSRSNIIE